MNDPQKLTLDDISVVIPARNEAERIGRCIGSVRDAGGTQIIVSDGQSVDDTAAAAAAAGADKVIASIPGRGIQLNAGAFFADRKVLLFLHADNRIDATALRQIVELRGVWQWGAMRQRIDDPALKYRWLEWGNATRVRLRSLAFGDQAVFVRRDVFRANGGFDEVPLMEDVQWSLRMRRRSGARLIDGPVIVDPRRWNQRGVIGQTLLNWKIQIAHRWGVDPATLARWYR